MIQRAGRPNSDGSDIRRDFQQAAVDALEKLKRQGDKEMGRQGGRTTEALFTGSIDSMKIQRHTELEVYKKAFDGAMNVFERSKSFPKEETYSLTDQIRRSSRSVCANLAEAWRKRRYEAAFVAKAFRR